MALHSPEPRLSSFAPPPPSGVGLSAALARVVAACLLARNLAEAWEHAAGRIAFSSLNAGLAAQRATQQQAVFASLSRETREVSGEIRTLADEGLPLARRLAQRSIRLIVASRRLEAIRRADRRMQGRGGTAEVTRQLAERFDDTRAALAPDLERLGAIFRELDWHLVRLHTLALYFRIEGTRAEADGVSFLATGAALEENEAALEGRGVTLAATFKLLEDQLASEEALTRHEE